MLSGKNNIWQHLNERGILNNQFADMIMEEVHILASDKTPEILLDPEGTIRIKGRGLSAMRTEPSDRILEVD